MNQINQVLLEGNVVKDAEISETAQGNYVSKFPIEVKRYYRNAKGETVTETCYFDVKAWGETFAQFCKRVKKGRSIRVVGRLKQDRWKNDDGKNLSKVYIVADHIDFAPNSESEEEAN